MVVVVAYQVKERGRLTLEGMFGSACVGFCARHWRLSRVLALELKSKTDKILDGFADTDSCNVFSFLLDVAITRCPTRKARCSLSQ